MKIQLKQFATLQKLWVLLENKDKKNGFLIFFLMVIGTIIELVGIGLIIPVLAILGDETIIHNYPLFTKALVFLGSPSHKQLVVYVMSLLLFVYLFKCVFLGYSIHKQSRFIYQLSAKISSKLFRLYLIQPYTFHLQRNSAELIRIVSTDVSMLSSVVQSLTIVLAELFVVLGIFTLMLVVEPIGAIASLVILTGSAWLFVFLTKSKLRKWGKENQYHGYKKFQHIQQGLSSSKDVKLLGREKEFFRKYDFHNEKIASLNEWQYTLSQYPRLFIELLAIMGLISVAISMVFIGKDIRVILPILSLFSMAAFRLMPSVNRIMSSVQTIQYSLPAVSVIHDELIKLKDVTLPRSTKNDVFKDELTVNNISFHYETSSKGILENVSFSISKGETIGIIGGSGAGKTTLIDLLLGLLQPTAGSIKVDEYDLQNCLREWQDQIGYVPQSIYLIDDTLRRNIAFGIADDDIDEEKVLEAVKAAQLEPFVHKLEQGLNTEVGERGVRLSGGQRQRIGIARALYHNPTILVLDEATSSLDIKTESSVMDAINALHGKKTIFIVAHRLTTVEKCDRILRFENGMLVEQGIPSEMLKSV